MGLVVLRGRYRSSRLGPAVGRTTAGAGCTTYRCSPVPGTARARSLQAGASTNEITTSNPQTCADLLAGMAPIEELLRSSGQYGPAVPVPKDADEQTRLLGFIGRDPLRGGQ
jgi:hypothetical protein